MGLVIGYGASYNKIKKINVPLCAVTVTGVPTFTSMLEGAALKETPGFTELKETLEGGALN